MLLTPWVSQPDESAALSSELAPSALWVGGVRVDLASTRPMSFGTSGSVVNSRAGRAFSATGTANTGRVVFGTDTGADKPGAGDFTVAIWFRLSSIATGYAAIGRWNTGATPSTSDWYLGAAGTFGGTTIDFTVAVGSSTYTASYSPSGWATGYDYVLVGRRRGTTIYVDRVTVIDGSIVSASTTNAGITTINANSARALKLGEIDAGAGFNAELTAEYVALFPRCISDAELRELWRQPSLLAEPVSGWVPASAGGGTYTVAQSESPSLADSYLSALSTASALTEAAATSDAITAALTAVAALAESIGSTDAAVAALTAAATASEAASASDTVSTGSQITGAVSEAATATDVQTAAALLVQLLTEPAAAADSVSAGSAAYSVSVSELASALEILAATLDVAGADLLRAPSGLVVASPQRQVLFTLGRIRRRIGHTLIPTE